MGEPQAAATPRDEVVVLVLVPIAERHVEMIREVDPRVRVLCTTDRERARQLAPRAEVIVGWQIPEPVRAQARRLRWVHAAAAGVDGLLFPEVVAGQVVLTSSVGAHTVALPEHVMAVILLFSRRLHVALRNQQARRWDRQALLGDELAGKVLGILGLGAIGSALAARAAAFGMRVVGTKRVPAPVPNVERVYGPEATDEVLQAADYVVILLPLTPQTRGLIDARRLRLMKRTAVLVNVGRGPIVQEAALLAALREGWIAGAALDVFEREPLPADSPLWGMENVVITPHVSGASPSYFDRVIPLFCENLRRYLAGAPLVNRVDPARGY
jgi:phosphoglycerate dehydrogenase-like enzyme